MQALSITLTAFVAIIGAQGAPPPAAADGARGVPQQIYQIPDGQVQAPKIFPFPPPNQGPSYGPYQIPGQAPGRAIDENTLDNLAPGNVQGGPRPMSAYQTPIQPGYVMPVTTPAATTNSTNTTSSGQQIQENPAVYEGAGSSMGFSGWRLLSIGLVAGAVAMGMM